MGLNVLDCVVVGKVVVKVVVFIECGGEVGCCVFDVCCKVCYLCCFGCFVGEFDV